MVNMKIFAITATLTTLAFSSPISKRGPSPKHGDVIPGKYIVTLNSDLESHKVHNHLKWVRDIHEGNLAKRRAASGKDKVEDRFKGIENDFAGIFNGYSGSFDDDTLAAIRNHTDVKEVEDDKVWVIDFIKPKSTPSDTKKRSETTESDATWGLGAISHRKNGSNEYVYDTNAGKDTYAYVVDSGVRLSHGEFEGRAVFGYSAYGDDESDSVGHGTHVAGTIAGKTYGVAKQATIVSVKTFDGQHSSTSNILGGFNWAAKDIVSKSRTSSAVINVSIEGPVSTAFNSAVEEAAAQGVLSIVAAGNQGEDASETSPASAKSAFAVAAIDEDWAIAWYSNYGSVVDIFGPGSDILSAWNSGDDDSHTLTGTSMATPHISGLALTAMSVHGVTGVSQVSDYLVKTSTSFTVSDDKGTATRLGNNNNDEE